MITFSEIFQFLCATLFVPLADAWARENAGTEVIGWAIFLIVGVGVSHAFGHLLGLVDVRFVLALKKLCILGALFFPFIFFIGLMMQAHFLMDDTVTDVSQFHMFAAPAATVVFFAINFLLYGRNLKHIKIVNLNGTRIRDDKRKGVVEFFDTRYVSLGDLADMQEMRVLKIAKTRVNGTGLTYLKNLPYLNELDISNTLMQDDKCRILRALRRLYVLNISGTSVGDGGIQYIADMESLQCLNLSDTVITDTGLISLVKLAQLQWLNLDRTAISDAGLITIGLMKNLKYLSVKGTNVSEDAKKFLSQINSIEIIG